MNLDPKWGEKALFVRISSNPENHLLYIINRNF